MYTIVAVGDRIFLGMQDFDFCPNLIKFYQIYPNFAQICLKSLAMGRDRIPSFNASVLYTVMI